jgi:subtilisin family serine protease
MPETRAEKYISSEENLPEDLYAMDIPDDVKNQFSRWAVGTEVSPLYSYRNLETQNEAMSLANDLNQAESGTLAYSGGVNVNFSPLRRLSVQSGLYYSRYGVNVDNAYVFEDATIEISSSSRFYSINYSSGVIETEDDMVDYVTNRGDHKYYSGITPNMDPMSLDFSSGEIVQNFEYLEVPLILRYKVIDRKIGFNLLGGLSTNLLVGSNTYYHSDGDREKIGETTEIKPFNYSSIVGLGLEYSVSKHLNLSLEPTFRYYLSSINQSSIIRSYPYSIGVFTGLRYSF